MKSAQSLLLITVDCLRADHTGFLGYERPTTPFMDSLAAESLIFRNAISTGVPTFYSFPGLMASRYPLALGRDVAGIAPEEPTLARALQESGYATAAFLAGNPYLSKRFGYETGFDTFVDSLDAAVEPLAGDSVGDPGPVLSSFNRKLARLSRGFGPAARVYDELYFRYCQRVAGKTPASFDSLRRFPAADVIVDRACDWLGGLTGSPFFLWLHFMDPHAPYYPPPQAMDLLNLPRIEAQRARYLNSYWNRRDLGAKQLARHRGEIVDLYDAGIRWVDSQISRLAKEFQRLGLWENCALAFTADHGEEFLDHGGRFHSPSKVYEELSHVPLLLRVPNFKPPKPAEPPFSLLDLAPTLLDIVDVPVPIDFRGSSHWPSLQDGQDWEDTAVTECVSSCSNPFHLENRIGPRILSVRESRYKLVVDYGSSTERLFDLDRDPKERQPLDPGAEKAVRQRLLDRARRHLADSTQSRDNDRRLAARLRDIRLEWAQPTAPLSK